MDVTVSGRDDTAIVPADGRIDTKRAERLDETLAGSRQEDGSS
jgi:anti-anti-sigma regulatory factor